MKIKTDNYSLSPMHFQRHNYKSVCFCIFAAI